VNSKQLLAAVSVVILVILLVYPTLSTGTVSVAIRSMKFEKADHVYLTVYSVWVHQTGQSSSAGWKLLANNSQTLDLVSLANSTKSIATGQVPLAGYDSIRLDVSNVTWVFNKTTSTLLTASPNLDSSLDFTVAAGRSLSITVVLSGHQEVIGTSKLFAASVNATMT
jgi:hypothetical protein